MTSKSMTETQKQAKPALMSAIHSIVGDDSYKKAYASNAKGKLHIKLYGFNMAKLTIDSVKTLRDFVKQANGTRAIEDDSLSFTFDIA